MLPREAEQEVNNLLMLCFDPGEALNCLQGQSHILCIREVKLECPHSSSPSYLLLSWFTTSVVTISESCRDQRPLQKNIARIGYTYVALNKKCAIEMHMTFCK